MTRMHLVEKIVLRKEGAAPDLFAWLDKHAAFAGTATSTGGFVISGQTSPQQKTLLGTGHGSSWSTSRILRALRRARAPGARRPGGGRRRSPRSRYSRYPS